MLRVCISELKNQLSRYLRAVRRGEAVEVTDRDKPVARLCPIEGGSSRSEGLINQEDQAFFAEQFRLGVLKKGTGKVPPEMLKDMPPGKPGVLAALIAERNEGR